MPAREYEIDDNDIPPYAAAGNGAIAAGASHVGPWYLTPVAPALDANQQVLQDQEVAFVTAFARNGNPNTTFASRRADARVRVRAGRAAGARLAAPPSELRRLRRGLSRRPPRP
jgi:hypothetical protein